MTTKEKNVTGSISVPLEVLTHALQHVKTASQLLFEAHAARPDTWLGFYDDALVHADITVKDLERLIVHTEKLPTETTSE
jgi:hypothetical protein